MQCAKSGMLALGVFFLTVLDYCVPFYHHQFAVHVPGGPGSADEIAHKHGFVNHGQVRTRLGSFFPVSVHRLLLNK